MCVYNTHTHPPTQALTKDFKNQNYRKERIGLYNYRNKEVKDDLVKVSV